MGLFFNKRWKRVLRAPATVSEAAMAAMNRSLRRAVWVGLSGKSSRDWEVDMKKAVGSVWGKQTY